MAKEKIIYRCRYERPYHERRKQPYGERDLQILEEVRYANHLRSYRVLATLTVAEKLQVEELMEGDFPFTVSGRQQDLLGGQIVNAVRRVQEDKL